MISGIIFMIFQGCTPRVGIPNNGVIKFDTLKILVAVDSTDKVDSTNMTDSLVVAKYNWNMVDTTGGFTTIATGIISGCSWQSSEYEAEMPLTIKETGFVKNMLVDFQKKFAVKITSFQAIRIYKENQIYLRVFFQNIENKNGRRF